MIVVPLFPLSINMTAMIELKYCLRVASNLITLTENDLKSKMYVTWMDCLRKCENVLICTMLIEHRLNLFIYNAVQPLQV